MCDNGWIKLHRSFLDWEWYKDANTSRVFVHCLIKANHEDKRWQGKAIKRGSFITSYGQLAIELGLSVHQVRVAINHLILTNEMTKSSSSKYTMFTIQNYDKYQANDKQTDNQMANKWQTSGKQVATTKNDKNYKNDKNDKNILYSEEKRAYGSFQNVLLTSSEYKKLMDKFPDYADKIENLSEYLESKGKKYKSHYAVILQWARKDTPQQTKGISIF